MPAQNFVRRGNALEFYQRHESLGRGAFGEVCRGVRRSDQSEWAMKFLNRKKMKTEDINGLLAEIKVLKVIEHENIVHVWECFDDGRKFFVMVMELMRGGELLQRISKRNVYTEKLAAGVIRDVASALAYCHSWGIAHRDIKPENLLLVSESSETVKVADFGFAKMRSDGEVLKTSCGTLNYAAPEILSRSRNRQYTVKVDMWSLGVVLYLLLCGHEPFEDENYHRLVNQIVKGVFRFRREEFAHVSDGAKDLVRQLLVVDPEDRYSAEQTLKHPWIVEQCDIKCTSTTELPSVPANAARTVEKRAVMRSAVLKLKTLYMLRESGSSGSLKQETKAQTKSEVEVDTKQEPRREGDRTSKVTPESQATARKSECCIIL